MITLYRDRKIHSTWDSKLEFNKFIETVAKALEETTDTSAQKFLWDIHMNDNAIEYPHDKNMPTILWDVTDDTGKWYRKDLVKCGR